jgi:GAG-pre-integrase domain
MSKNRACVAEKNSISIWHAILGHANVRGLSIMSRNRVALGFYLNGMDLNHSICLACVYGNSHRI